MISEKQAVILKPPQDRREAYGLELIGLSCGLLKRGSIK